MHFSYFLCFKSLVWFLNLSLNGVSQALVYHSSTLNKLMIVIIIAIIIIIIIIIITIIIAVVVNYPTIV